MPHAEVLRHAHERVVDRGVAMRVVLAQDLPGGQQPGNRRSEGSQQHVQSFAAQQGAPTCVSIHSASGLSLRFSALSCLCCYLTSLHRRRTAPPPRPRTSPTTRAHFLYGLLWVMPRSCIAYLSIRKPPRQAGL